MSRPARLAAVGLIMLVILLFAARLMAPSPPIDLPPPTGSATAPPPARAGSRAPRDVTAVSQAAGRAPAPQVQPAPPSPTDAGLLPPEPRSILRAIETYRDRVDVCFALLEQAGTDPARIDFEGRIEAVEDRGQVDGVAVFLPDRVPLDAGLGHCFERALDGAPIAPPTDGAVPFAVQIDPP
jgi:hypothetical protein